MIYMINSATINIWIKTTAEICNCFPKDIIHSGIPLISAALIDRSLQIKNIWGLLSFRYLPAMSIIIIRINVIHSKTISSFVILLWLLIVGWSKFSNIIFSASTRKLRVFGGLPSKTLRHFNCSQPRMSLQNWERAVWGLGFEISRVSRPPQKKLCVNLEKLSKFLGQYLQNSEFFWGTSKNWLL